MGNLVINNEFRNISVNFIRIILDVGCKNP